jgi:hypothetical protein
VIITSNESHEQGPGETVTYCADFTNKLRENETFTGNPTVTEITTTALSISNEARLTADFTDPLGNTVAAGKGVVFTVSSVDLDAAGGDVNYTIRVLCTTTTGDVREMRCRITGTTR